MTDLHRAMNYSEALAYLYSLGHEVLAAKFRLEGIKLLLDKLGDPHHSFQSLIVAGTNGKGSTAAMIEAMARAAGHRSGLYTSPHLVRIEERMQVCGAQITSDDFARLATNVRSASEALAEEELLDSIPSFFEQVTAIAMLFFKEQRVELAVLEVGLGGRLDATNAVEPLVSVITAIGHDHQDVLGSEIGQIAVEKAAVIKPHGRAVIGRQDYREAEDVLMQRCLEVGVLPVFVNEAANITFSQDGCAAFDYDSCHAAYTGLRLGLRGRHQVENAAAAIEAAEIISECGFRIEAGHITAALGEVDWPGRLEMVLDRPRLLLDGAHNLDSARRLRAYLDEFCQPPLTLVFGAMADKDLEGMARILFGIARTIVLTRVRDRRAATSAQMGKFALDRSCNVIFTESVSKALSWAKSVTPPNGLICITGSLHLIGEVKALFESEDDQRRYVSV